MSDSDRWWDRWPEEIHAALEHAATGPVTVDMTTIGQKSGLERRIEIWFVVVDERVIITGTPRPRDWLANLLASPHCTLHFKDDPSAKGILVDVPCSAVVITDPPARKHVLEHSATVWYRNQSPIQDLLARAPMVELSPVAD